MAKRHASKAPEPPPPQRSEHPDARMAWQNHLFGRDLSLRSSWECGCGGDGGGGVVPQWVPVPDDPLHYYVSGGWLVRPSSPCVVALARREWHSPLRPSSYNKKEMRTTNDPFPHSLHSVSLLASLQRPNSIIYLERLSFSSPSLIITCSFLLLLI